MINQNYAHFYRACTIRLGVNILPTTTHKNTTVKNIQKSLISKKKIVIKQPNTKKINTLIFKKAQTNNQQFCLHKKYRYGLFKTQTIDNRMVKNQLFFLSNLLKNKKLRSNTHLFFRKPRIMFSKKFNKLFFRAGRSILIKKINFKKNLIQKFVTKHIKHFIKNDWTISKTKHYTQNILIKTNLFFSKNDATLFILNFGILINKHIVYDPQYNLNIYDTFSIMWHKNTLLFFLKKRRKIVSNLKNIKFYKFRSKFFISKFKRVWIPSHDWLNEHIFMYYWKNTDFEFDVRTLTGVCLKNTDKIIWSNVLEYSNISLYMTRSYNWKYIT